MTSDTRDYQFFDEKCHSGYNRRSIDGKVTGCNKCVGYCQFSGHSGFLTESQQRDHNCIGKGCFYYLPKLKKERLEDAQVKSIEKIKSIIERIVSGYEGLKATKICEKSDGVWIVKYISITNGYSIESIEEKLSNMLERPVVMCKVECDFEKAVTAIFGLNKSF